MKVAQLAVVGISPEPEESTLSVLGEDGVGVYVTRILSIIVRGTTDDLQLDLHISADQLPIVRSAIEAALDDCDYDG